MVTLFEELILHFSDFGLQFSMHIYQIYSLLSLLIYYLTYRYLWVKSSHRVIASVLLLISIGFFVLKSITGSFGDDFPSQLITINSTILVIFSILHFKNMLDEKEGMSLKLRPDFWLNVAIFMYWSVFLLHFGLYNTILNLNLENELITTINVYFSIVYYTVFGFTFFLDTSKGLSV